MAEADFLPDKGGIIGVLFESGWGTVVVAQVRGKDLR